MLKILAAQPDAVLIAGAGTPAATPHKEFVSRGLQGEDLPDAWRRQRRLPSRCRCRRQRQAVLPAGPMLVYEQLPDSNPVKKSAAEYVKTYEAKYGAGSRTTFGGHAWDAYMLLQRAIPEALKRASRAAKAFRGALRDALENSKDVAGSNGVFSINAGDHNGMDNRAPSHRPHRKRQVGSGEMTLPTDVAAPSRASARRRQRHPPRKRGSSVFGTVAENQAPRSLSVGSRRHTPNDFRRAVSSK